MKGDKLVIHKGHIKAARSITELLIPLIVESKNRFIITIAGESGSGKSEVAVVFEKLLFERKNIRSIVIQQDDYFLYPPKTNAEMRRKDIEHVGVQEVRLELLDSNLMEMLKGKNEVEKPLVIFDEDRVIKEKISLEGIKVIIVEGTYTTLLKNVDQHVFIDRTYVDTGESRRRRAREEQDGFLEQILEIEHRIIASHKSQADIIIAYDYGAQRREMS